MDELIGMAFGPYTITEKIGEGGMAIVYRGYQEALNRYVAIKVLRPELARDQEFVARFRQEALGAATLSHPNIVYVYDAGMAHGRHYIAMAFVEGGSLRDLIQQGPLGVDRAVSIAIQLAEALEYAHQHGLIHRDVKPSNVLMTREGRPLLTDFGIAKALYEAKQLTRTGASLGTPEYMSPEQVEGRRPDGRTDIYALGIVLFEMLTGQLPFHADTPVATLYKQLHEATPSLRQVAGSVPAWLEVIVNKALAKRPEERYQQAGELAEALRQQQKTLAPAPRPGTPVPTVPPAGQKRSRAPVLLLAAIGVLLLATSAAAAYLLLGGPGDTQDKTTPTLAATTYITRVVIPSPATAEQGVGPRVVSATPPAAAPTEPPTPIPTRTPTPTPLPTQSPTPSVPDTATPTRTPPPANTPTATKRPPAPGKTPTTAADRFRAPNLLEPADGRIFAYGDTIVLIWQSVGKLPEDGYYEVLVAYSPASNPSETWYDETPWTKETRWTLSEHSYLPGLSADGRFRWSVRVMRKTGQNAQGRPTGTPLSPTSGTRTLIWQAPAAPGGGGGSGGPGGPATDTPAPP